MLILQFLDRKIGKITWVKRYKIHTVGPANKEVPESAIAEQPSAQNPEIEDLKTVTSNKK